MHRKNLSINAIEIAILTKETLHAAWMEFIRLLDEPSVHRKFPSRERSMLIAVYTQLYLQTYHAPVNTYQDVRKLVLVTRKLLRELKSVDINSWHTILSAV